jgi:O-succinylbenzoic acid--CoA ligase
MVAFAAAAAGRGPVFLVDPAWRADERARADEIIAQVAVGSAEASAGSVQSAERGWLMIPSGGTGGRLKFARHDQDTIAAAVSGFGRHFAVGRVDAVGVLPLYHVSGFMAWMRCLLTGGTYVPWSWPELAAGRWPGAGSRPTVDRERPLNERAAAPAGNGVADPRRPGGVQAVEPAEPGGGERGRFLSLVPTQLQRLLTSAAAVEQLRRFSALLIGGGPVWPELTEAAARLGLPVALGYGMTETAAMVASQRQGEFLAGRRNCGPALPHARIDLTNDGRIRIAGASVCRGFLPEEVTPADFATGTFVTEDLGELDGDGQLTVLGRRDAVIITGGKKVDPLEVEAVLRATGEFEDLAVIGLPDGEWGSAVTVCYPAAVRPAPDPARMAAALAGLSSFKHPKRFRPIDPWPRNAQGKVNRAELARLAAPDPAQSP